MDYENCTDMLNQSDDEVDDVSHNTLLTAINSLVTKKKAPKSQRSEPSGEVSEFSLSNTASSTDGHKLHLGDLLGGLKHSTANNDIKKQVSRVRGKKKLLSAPLHKPEAERIERSIAYDSTRKEISRWNTVVESNRQAEQISFPLNQSRISLHARDEFMARFQPRTPLEKEIAVLLHGSKALDIQEKALTPAEERALKAMSLAEAREHRREVQKMRALLAYKKTKARRQNKIKSKRYHRLLKKEKEKQESKLLEDGVTPEEAEARLKQLEKARVTERASLKHRNTGKWAKKLIQHGKFDDAARQAIQDQIQISKTRTAKPVIYSDSEEEEEYMVEVKAGENFTNNANPWMRSVLPSKETKHHIEDSTVNLENKHADIIGQESDDAEEESTHHIEKLEKLLNYVHSSDVKADTEDDAYDEEEIVETLTRKQTINELDNMPPDEDRPTTVSNSKNRKSNVIAPESRSPSKKTVQINPKDYLRLEPQQLNSTAPDVAEDDEDQGGSQQMTIAEAFADDDVIEEFKQEKQEIISRDKPKDIDLTLPGWGSWGGTGIQPSKRKRRRFLIKASPALPRKDRGMQHVILSEAKVEKAAAHQVKSLPFPFNSVRQFEASIRAPVGKTWNPETSFQKLTVRPVTTKMGTVIEPINPSDVFEKTEKRKMGKGGLKFEDTLRTKAKTRKSKGN